jgi:sucrose phosphorylase
MDVNASSPLVWDFYEETLKKLRSYGCNILRLDAFAYLHKRLRIKLLQYTRNLGIFRTYKTNSTKNDLVLLPEIHAEYGLNLHDEVAKRVHYL